MFYFRFAKRSFWVLCGVAAAFLSGCAASNGTAARRDPVRGVASSFLAARAFDRAQVALRRDDNAALERAGRELRRASSAGFTPRLSGAFASQLANQAGLSGQLAGLSRGEEMIDLLQDSERKYRAALAFAPEKAPEKTLDAVTLNALGYFLADRGTTKADFERAAVLTYAAYRAWPLGKGTDAGAKGAGVLSRAQGPQDSFAWALFKLGKWNEARVLQEQVWDLSRGMGASDVTGEIPFHLGEIYRALGQKEKARDAYYQAMRLPTDFRIKAKIEGALQLLDLAQV